MPILKCSCPLYCVYCGRRRSRDAFGHYCKTENCQNQHGVYGCYYSAQREFRAGQAAVACGNVAVRRRNEVAP